MMRLDKFIANNKTGYTVGNNLTEADVAVFVFCTSLSSGFWDHLPVGRKAFGKLENILKVKDMVAGIPAVQERYKKLSHASFKSFIESAELDKAKKTEVKAPKWAEETDP